MNTCVPELLPRNSLSTFLRLHQTARFAGVISVGRRRRRKHSIRRACCVLSNQINEHRHILPLELARTTVGTHREALTIYIFIYWSALRRIAPASAASAASSGKVCHVYARTCVRGKLDAECIGVSNVRSILGIFSRRKMLNNSKILIK